jgi:hypothetical protein
METKRLQLLSDISLVFLGPGNFDDRLTRPWTPSGIDGRPHAFFSWILRLPKAVHEPRVVCPRGGALRSTQDVRYDRSPLVDSMRGAACL